MINPRRICLIYEQNDQVVRLLHFQDRGEQNWICPQHLPTPIPPSARLASKLPRFEKIISIQGHP